MDALIEALKNSTWQAYVFSPLASVLFSMILIPSSPRVENEITVNQAINSYNTTNSYNHINSHNRINIYASEATNPAGDFTILFALAAPVAYLHFAPQVLHWIVVAAIFALTMSIILAVRAIFLRAITDVRWMFRLSLPPFIAITVIYTSNLALSLYYVPTGSGWQWIVFQALGISFMCMSLLAAWLNLVNSMCQLGDSDVVRASPFRIWVIEATRRYTLPGFTVIAMVFAIVALLLINGLAAEWLMSFTSNG